VAAIAVNDVKHEEEPIELETVLKNELEILETENNNYWQMG